MLPGVGVETQRIVLFVCVGLTAVAILGCSGESTPNEPDAVVHWEEEDVSAEALRDYFAEVNSQLPDHDWFWRTLCSLAETAPASFDALRGIFTHGDRFSPFQGTPRPGQTPSDADVAKLADIILLECATNDGQKSASPVVGLSVVRAVVQGRDIVADHLCRSALGPCGTFSNGLAPLCGRSGCFRSL
jgi:hypothetical protein